MSGGQVSLGAQTQDLHRGFQAGLGPRWWVLRGSSSQAHAPAKEHQVPSAFSGARTTKQVLIDEDTQHVERIFEDSSFRDMGLTVFFIIFGFILKA